MWIAVGIEEVVADKGYYTTQTLTDLEFTEGLRTYVALPKQKHRRQWRNLPEERGNCPKNNVKR